MAETPRTTYRLQLRSGFGFADAELGLMLPAGLSED